MCASSDEAFNAVKMPRQDCSGLPSMPVRRYPYGVDTGNPNALMDWEYTDFHHYLNPWGKLWGMRAIQIGRPPNKD